MKISIRTYTPEDAGVVGRLIADTYRKFNLAFAAPDLQDRMLGPFQFAGSDDPDHKAAVAQVVASPMCYVAEVDGQIAGVLRGREERLASLFVGEAFHRKGVGRALVERFEADSAAQGVSVIRVAATRYAVPFYSRLGYKKSTGERISWSFEGYGLPVQPMKKVLPK